MNADGEPSFEAARCTEMETAESRQTYGERQLSGHSTIAQQAADERVALLRPRLHDNAQFFKRHLHERIERLSRGARRTRGNCKRVRGQPAAVARSDEH